MSEYCQYKKDVFSDPCRKEAKWAVQYWTDYPAAEWKTCCDDHVVQAESEGNWRSTEVLRKRRRQEVKQ